MLIKEGLHAEQRISVSMKELDTTQQSTTSPTKSLPLLPTKYKFLTTTLPINQNQAPLAFSRLTSIRDDHLQRCKSYQDLDLCVAASTKRRSPPKKGDHQDRRSMANDQVMKANDKDFKCGALCLFLPGFGKGKPVRAGRPEQKGPRHVISQRVSLEKFECGSWRSSTFLSGDECSSNPYFDLPLELIRTSVSDAALPMNSAFVFDKDVKGVLKTRGGAGERKSQEARRVRFSTSSPPTTQPTSPSSCITPRLRKAREDFNAFLEAQSA